MISYITFKQQSFFFLSFILDKILFTHNLEKLRGAQTARSDIFMMFLKRTFAIFDNFKHRDHAILKVLIVCNKNC